MRDSLLCLFPPQSGRGSARIGHRASCRLPCRYVALLLLLRFFILADHTPFFLLLRRPSHIRPDAANRPEQLVPIRLEFDVEHHKMRDTFVWNLNGGRRFWTLVSARQRVLKLIYGRAFLLKILDPVVTPEIFAQSIVDDYGLAPHYHVIITKSIQDQLTDYRAHTASFVDDDVESDGDAVVMKGRLEGEEEMWWEGWRKRLRTDTASMGVKKGKSSRKKRKMLVVDGRSLETKAPAARANANADKDMVGTNVADIEVDEKDAHEEMRILIKVSFSLEPLRFLPQCLLNAVS